MQRVKFCRPTGLPEGQICIVASMQYWVLCHLPPSPVAGRCIDAMIWPHEVVTIEFIGFFVAGSVVLHRCNDRFHWENAGHCIDATPPFSREEETRLHRCNGGSDWLGEARCIDAMPSPAICWDASLHRCNAHHTITPSARRAA